MIIKPKMRGFISLNSHPEGCAKNVENQRQYAQDQAPLPGKKRVLIIGSSMGYGLASRISSIVGGASTLGVFFEKPPTETKTASAGYYNDYYLRKWTKDKNLYYKSLNANAFSLETKQQVIETIRKDWGEVDLVIYSLAAPRREIDGKVYQSVLKTIGPSFIAKTSNFQTGEVKEIEIPSASEEEIEATTKVMGGEDWQMWISLLKDNHLLAKDFKTISYSYIGPTTIGPIYNGGTIGRAKEHLHQTAETLHQMLSPTGGSAHVCVCKALITQASSAIPCVGLYTAILYKVMKDKNLHEGCIEQIIRLFKDHLFTPGTPTMIRIDDLELREDVQKEVIESFNKIDTESYSDLADAHGVRQDFMNIFGFDLKGVDYDKEQKINI